MLSRVADSIYWMTRYVERVENVARFIDVNALLMIDLLPGVEQQWEPLVEITGDAETFKQRHGEPNQDNVIEFLTFDTENPNSIISCLRKARENARSIREIISSPMWAEINEAYLFVEAEAARSRRDYPFQFLKQVKRYSQILEGVTDATLSRDEAWHFSRMGRLLERADKSTRIVDVKYFMLLPSPDDVGSPTDDLHWTAVLQSASAYEMYRQKHGMVRSDKTAEFLVLDPLFPRSVRHCVKRADESLRAIGGNSTPTFRNPAERRLGQLAAYLEYTVMEEVILDGLHEFLDDLQARLNEVGNAIQQSFFPLRPANPT